MSLFSNDSQTVNRTKRQLLIAIVALVPFAGCGGPVAPEAEPFTVPVEFSDDRGTWELRDGDLAANDNQEIGAFFKQNQSLIGSPEWTGDPEKYLCKDVAGLKRFYWFSGNSENPSWNALEVGGGRVRQLSGVGVPGDSKIE